MATLNELINLINIYEEQGMSLEAPVIFVDAEGQEHDFTGIVNHHDHVSIALKKI